MSADKWPDGTKRSTGNCFTHTLEGAPIGYQPGTEVRRSKGVQRVTRPKNPFNMPNGRIPGIRGTPP